DMPRRRDPDPTAIQLIGVQRRDDVERVGKWRNEIRARHRTDLERRYAKSEQLADDLYLAVGGQHLRRELQPVAQCHIAELGVRRARTRCHVSAPISSSLRPNTDDNTSWVCSPRSGPTLRIGSDAPPITGTMPGKPTVLRCASPVSTSKCWIMFRASYWSSAQMSAAVEIGPDGTPASSSSLSASSRLRSMVHCPIAASSSSRRRQRPALVCSSGSSARSGRPTVCM